MDINQTKFVFLLLSVIAALLGSCGQESSKEDPPAVTQPVTPGSPSEEFVLNCDPQGACPGYIAAIRISNQNGETLASCSGFLTDSNAVFTSDQCVQKTARPPVVDDCGDVNIEVFFPQTQSFKAEKAGCKSVQSAFRIDGVSDPLKWKKNTMVIELDREVEREILPWSQEGVEGEQEVIVWALGDASRTRGLISSQVCKVKLGHIINRQASTPYSPQMVLANCQVSQESAGGPVIDPTTGMAVGGVSSPVVPERQEVIDDLFLSHVPFAHATNYSCLGVLGRVVPTQNVVECNRELRPLPIISESLKPNYFDEYRVGIETLFGELGPYGFDIGVWQVTFGRVVGNFGGYNPNPSNGQIFMPFGVLPKCLNTEKMKDDRELRKKMRRFGIFGLTFWKKRFELEFELPYAGLELLFNEELDIEVFPSPSEMLEAADGPLFKQDVPFRYILGFNPRDLYNNNATDFDVKIIDPTIEDNSDQVIYRYPPVSGELPEMGEVSDRLTPCP